MNLKNLVPILSIFIGSICPANDFQSATTSDNKKTSDSTKCKTINATDFDKYTEIDGFANAKKDFKNKLNILSIPKRDAWAAAQLEYKGEAKKVGFSLITMQEQDGESSYIVKVNGKLIGKCTNSSIYGTDIKDYTTETHHLSKSIQIKKGDIIQVEFNNTTNGKVPEGELTATSRGRWVALEICYK